MLLLPVGLAFTQLLQGVRCLPPALIDAGVPMALLPEFAIAVEKIQMAAGIEQLLLIVLTGDIDQMRAQFCRQLGGDALVIDKEPGTPVFVQYPAEDALAAGRVFQAMLLKQLLQRLVGGRNGKHRLNGRLLAVAAHPGAGAAPAGEQIHRLQDNGLARAGFAGEHGQAVCPRRQIQMKRVYERKAMDAQRMQHDFLPWKTASFAESISLDPPPGRRYPFPVCSAFMGCAVHPARQIQPLFLPQFHQDEHPSPLGASPEPLPQIPSCLFMNTPP